MATRLSEASPVAAGTIRIVVVTACGALAISGLSLGAGNWRLGVQCAGCVVLWAATKRCTHFVARLAGYGVGAAAVVFGTGFSRTSGVASLLTFAVIVVTAFCVEDSRRRWRSVGDVPVVLVWALISLGAIYACVPETDHIRWLALAVGALILGEFLLGGVVEVGLSTVVVGLLGWAVLYGGHFRNGAMAGGLGSFGLLIIEPVTNALRRLASRPSPAERGRAARAVGGAALVVLQVFGCLAMARGGGLRVGAWSALVVVAPVLVGMLLVCWTVSVVTGTASSPAATAAFMP